MRLLLQDGVEYPAMLLTTGDHDDRVVPSHTLKFIAELQHKVGKLDKQVKANSAHIDKL
jgi:prolyl oligopeptidase